MQPTYVFTPVASTPPGGDMTGVCARTSSQRQFAYWESLSPDRTETLIATSLLEAGMTVAPLLGYAPLPSLEGKGC